MAPLSSHSNSL